MKKLIFLFALLAIGSSTVLGQVPVSGPALKFEKEVHDFGTVEQGGNTTVDFEFSNDGNQPLVLSQVKGSCTCTVPQWTKEPILPGETGTITVKYDSKRLGPINKSVTVHSNDPEKPVKIIRIKGNVQAG